MNRILRAKNDQAFKAVFDSYYRSLCLFAYHYVKDTDLAKDVAQDAFVIYWSNKKNVSTNEKAIKSYLYSTAKFISLNIIRHHNVANSHSNYKHLLYPKEECFTEKMIRAETLNEIHAALNLLPESCREVFRLSYFEGCSNAKIAEIMKVSINTVKTQKQRGFKTLRLNLDSEMLSFFLAFLFL